MTKMTKMTKKFLQIPKGVLPIMWVRSLFFVIRRYYMTKTLKTQNTTFDSIDKEKLQSLQSLIKKALYADGKIFKASHRARLQEKLTKVFCDVDKSLSATSKTLSRPRVCVNFDDKVRFLR